MRMFARGGKDKNCVQFADYDHRNQVYISTQKMLQYTRKTVNFR